MAELTAEMMAENLVDLMVFEMAYRLVDVLALRRAGSMDLMRVSLPVEMLVASQVVGKVSCLAVLLVSLQVVVKVASSVD